jgi:beta-mannosidase
MFWCFQDGWPLVNWGVVDYFNEKKLAYDYLQESMRDVQAICGEAENGQHPVVIVNDTLQPVQGNVTVKRVGETAPLLDTKFEVKANDKTNVGSIPQPKDSQMWELEWKLKDGREFKAHYLATQSKIRLSDYVGWMKQLGIRMP